MNKRTLILSLLIFSFIYFFADTDTFAQEKSGPLAISLDEAVDMALKASEDLQLQDNEVQRKRSGQKEEQTSLFPKILGSVEWSNNFEYPNTAATYMTKEYHVDAGVAVSQTVFTFGRISHAIHAAKQAFEASRFDKETTKQEVTYNAKMVYYNTYLAKRILEIAEESYSNALKNKEILEDRSSAGRVSKFDNIKIAADIASRKPSVNNARADFASALESLKVMIGVESKVSVDLKDHFGETYPDFERDALALSLYHNQPAIKALAKTIEEKDALIKSKVSTLFPEVSAFATWNHKGDGNDYDIGSDNMDDYGVAGLKVTIPVWLGGISREKLYQAKIDKKDAELNYQKGKKDYLLLLDKAVNEYREYKNTLEANNEAVRLAEEAFRYSQEIFGSGQISVTDLNDAELQLTNAKISREITLFNLNSTLAVIERLTLMETDDE